MQLSCKRCDLWNRTARQRPPSEQMKYLPHMGFWWRIEPQASVLDWVRQKRPTVTTIIASCERFVASTSWMQSCFHWQFVCVYSRQDRSQSCKGKSSHLYLWFNSNKVSWCKDDTSECHHESCHLVFFDTSCLSTCRKALNARLRVSCTVMSCFGLLIKYSHKSIRHTRATSPGQLRHPGETEHVDRLQRSSVLQLRWSASAFKPIHVQPGSIPVHQKRLLDTEFEMVVWLQKAPNNNPQTKKNQLRRQEVLNVPFLNADSLISSLFRLLWSDDRRSPPTFVPSFWSRSPLSAALHLIQLSRDKSTACALHLGAQRSAVIQAAAKARGEERRRGERSSGGTEKEGGWVGRTKGKHEGRSLVLLCPTCSGASSPGDGGGKRRQRQESED